MPAEAQTTTEFPLPQPTGGTLGNLQPSSDTLGFWFSETNLSQIVEILTDGTVKTFATPTPNAGPTNVFSGIGGEIWFSEPGLSQLGMLTISSDSGLQPITEFRTPTPNSGPGTIARDANANLWFVENTANQIGTLTTQGVFLGEFPIPTPNPGIEALVLGPDNNLWFAETNANKIGMITGNGTITEFPLPTANAGVGGLIIGDDGAFWFNEATAGQIGRITTAGSISEFPITTRNGDPTGLADGGDGNIWFIESAANQIGVMSTSGAMVAEFPIPSPNSGATSLRVALDQSLWFLEPNANKIARVTTNHAITEFPIPTANSGAHGLVVGPDQAMWFTESANKIARTTAFDESVDLAAAILPGARSVMTGETATAFATIINAGTATGTACRIGLNAPLVQFHYQTTDPMTNIPTGTPDMPVDILPGASQSFFISLSRDAPTIPVFFEAGFFCANSNPSQVYLGVDTFTLRVSDTPIPDIVAVSATATQDGILNLDGATGINAFAIATTNVGAGAMITAQPFASVSGLPISLQICQTDPATGACLAAPADFVNTQINQGDTPTFSIFVSGSGNVPFNPATNRIRVFFLQNGVTSGLTSVAVRTQ